MKIENEISYKNILKLNNELLKMLQDKNQYIVERHLTKDYDEWKIEHDKKATL